MSTEHGREFSDGDHYHLGRIHLQRSPPILEANQGDVHLIHAHNGLGDVPTALHAHGMMFNGTNHFDGAMGVTQCGIPPGETLDYSIDTSLNHGTYWIHGHHNGQYVDGLRARKCQGRVIGARMCLTLQLISSTPRTSVPTT